MALFRALESSRPAATRLFEDRFARGFLRPSLWAVSQCARLPLLGAVVPWFIDRKWPGARSSGIARTRLIDDMLVGALRDGIDQVVILGAGFDCRACRMPDLERTRVFEVDHPGTLATKRDRLRRMLRALPRHIVFVGVDFNRQDLRVALEASGFGRARRTFFIWEGVTNYLTERAVDATLRFVGSAAAGSQLCFTYVHRGLLDGSAHFEGTENLARTLGRAGEPWTFGFDPADVPRYLEARGLQLAADFGASEYRARYTRSGGRRMKGYEFYRAALARVSGTGGGAGSTVAPADAAV